MHARAPLPTIHAVHGRVVNDFTRDRVNGNGPLGEISFRIGRSATVSGVRDSATIVTGIVVRRRERDRPRPRLRNDYSRSPSRNLASYKHPFSDRTGGFQGAAVDSCAPPLLFCSFFHTTREILERVASFLDGFPLPAVFGYVHREPTATLQRSRYIWR